MTTAPQLAVGTTLQNIDDTSYSVFQNRNAPNSAQLVCGNIFLGLQGYCAVVIPLGEQLGLARGGTIETALTNAAVTFRAAAAWAAGGTISVNCCLDDSPRAGPLDARLAWKPPAGFGPAWRRDFWGSFQTELRDPAAASLFLNGPSGVGVWGIRAVAGQRDELAQVFTVPGGGWTVRDAIMQLRRFGNPIGSMEVAIQASQSDGYGHFEPDGVDIAVSAGVLNSTIALNPGSTFATFTFTPDVVLPAGDYWAVVRSTAPYPVSITDFIVWMQRRAFFNTGGSHRTLNGVRFGIGNFPGHVDVAQDLHAKPAGTAITWNPPARALGQSVTTPDLSALVQEVILNSGHETASALCFFFTTVGQTITYRFAANAHATLDPPGFAAQYRRRDIAGGIL